MPKIEINQSNDSYIKVDNITSIYKDVSSPTTIKGSINELYTLNKFHIFPFETSTQINCNKQILQYVGGATRIK
jgi:hypothetical protein